MTNEEAREITADRLTAWAGRLAPLTGTPAVLIAIGHGPDAVGELHVFYPDGLTGDMLLAVLSKARSGLEGAIARGEMQ